MSAVEGGGSAGREAGRAKAFVAFMWNPDAEWDDDGEGSIYRDDMGADEDGDACVPCVVTPLLPGDPRPGEVWLDQTGRRVLIVSTPITTESNFIPRVVVESADNDRRPLEWIAIKALRRQPVTKRFRLPAITWRGESKEDALRQIAERLEEVE